MKICFLQRDRKTVGQECTEENLSAETVLEVPILKKYLVAFTE